jgi:hypothetical protein
MKPEPFLYPATPHKRKHGPFGYDNYESYRPWLRDEFSFRCVFCLQREQWPGTRSGRWAIDHLLPREKHPEKLVDYDNLLYLCHTCNGNKRAKLVPDPCRVALGRCLRVHADGRISARNRQGRLLVRILRLDNDDYTEMRRQVIGILTTCAKHKPDLFVSLMRYPNDLPDLGTCRPPGNSRPNGVQNCCFALRAKGALPELY